MGHYYRERHEQPVATTTTQDLSGLTGHVDDDEELRATQAALELAAELGVDPANITGTGLDGRITKADVEAAADAG
jgi:pyruvate/2-oxoglutarate dehydrogenase complex dihydrolipoamide acyltransferase (E2) component